MMFLSMVVDAGTGTAVAVGVLAACVRVADFLVHRRMSFDDAMTQIRLSLARWLALSLELALAADILRSVIAPTWDDIGKLAAIAALRTVLNYFLEKEIERGAMSLTRRVA